MMMMMTSFELFKGLSLTLFVLKNVEVPLVKHNALVALSPIIFTMIMVTIQYM